MFCFNSCKKCTSSKKCYICFMIISIDTDKKEIKANEYFVEALNTKEIGKIFQAFYGEQYNFLFKTSEIIQEPHRKTDDICAI